MVQGSGGKRKRAEEVRIYVLYRYLSADRFDVAGIRVGRDVFYLTNILL